MHHDHQGKRWTFCSSCGNGLDGYNFCDSGRRLCLENNMGIAHVLAAEYVVKINEYDENNSTPVYNNS